MWREQKSDGELGRRWGGCRVGAEWVQTSQQTRVIRGPTPLYRAMMPSLAMSSLRQWIEEVYLAASRPCIRLLMTSRPWKMMTEKPPANAPEQAEPSGVLR